MFVSFHAPPYKRAAIRSAEQEIRANAKGVRGVAEVGIAITARTGEVRGARYISAPAPYTVYEPQGRIQSCGGDLFRLRSYVRRTSEWRMPNKHGM